MSAQNISEFELDGRHFRAQRLNARQQFHLSRRLAPLLPPIGRMLVAKGEGDSILLAQFMSGEGSAAGAAKLLELAEPVALALAGMKDEDADKIFEETLCSVQVESPSAPGTWLPVWISKGNSSLLPELNDFSALVPIILRVVALNLGNFTSGFLTNREEPKQPTAGGVVSPMVRTG